MFLILVFASDSIRESSESFFAFNIFFEVSSVAFKRFVNIFFTSFVSYSLPFTKAVSLSTFTPVFPSVIVLIYLIPDCLILSIFVFALDSVILFFIVSLIFLKKDLMDSIILVKKSFADSDTYPISAESIKILSIQSSKK